METFWLRWRCGERACPKRRRQHVSAIGEFDPVDAALAALESHYRRHHPEQAEQQEVGDVEFAAAA